MCYPYLQNVLRYLRIIPAKLSIDNVYTVLVKVHVNGFHRTVLVQGNIASVKFFISAKARLPTEFHRLVISNRK